MPRIEIRGLTGGGDIGGYETQLGNVAVVIPMVKLLHSFIPDAEIATRIQLTDEFCAAHGVTRIPNPPKLIGRRADVILRLFGSLLDLSRIALWRLIKRVLRLNLRILICGRKLSGYRRADVVLDFNGDIFPSDIHPVKVAVHALEMAAIRKLGIPVVEFVSSPGPFNTYFRRAVSKFMYNRLNVMVNREDVSSELVKQLGVDPPVISAACPAFLLETAPAEKAKAFLAAENVDAGARPLIGMTLCGYNLPSQRTWGHLSSFKDLEIYVPALKWLLDELKANVFLLPHVYRRNPYTIAGEFINGPDYDISGKLYEMVEGDKYGGRFKVIQGKYSSSEAKAIIGQCDMFISGRIHAAVAAMSQCVPTVVIAYGHKHRGFARVVGQEENVFQGTDAEGLMKLAQKVWQDRQEVRKTLQANQPRMKELVDLGIEIVRDIVGLEAAARDRIPAEMVARWLAQAEKLHA